MTQFATGCTTRNPAATTATKSISFTLNPVGSPSVPGSTSSFGLQISGTSTDQRVLQIVVSPISITAPSSGVVRLTVPGDAVLSIYGKNSAGTATANATITNGIAQYVQINNNTFSFNYGAVLTTLTSGLTSPTTGSSTFLNLANKTGTFNVKAVLSSNVTVAKTGGALLSTGSVTVTNNTSATVSGNIIEGIVTINP
ncbi:MAG: hypothetical protein NTX56_01970 [Proteobacteria bacterium]|nr:hypothetical protein [Pseudomonadota bacterium]